MSAEQRDPDHVSILIIGAGPTGLGAATRLEQLGHESYLLVEANSEAGGLASSVCTEEGFWFDLGGHVIFSHYEYFDGVLQHCVGRFDDETCWAKHKRESFVYLDDGQWVPYPFQLNFGVLRNSDIKMECLKGLIEVHTHRKIQQELERLGQQEGQARSKLESFDDWILASMGTGIHKHFMEPYNFKVWAYPTTELSYTWLGERVATVDLDVALRNCLRHNMDEDEDESRQWGPNAFFHFPQRGGTGSVWKAVSDKAVPRKRQKYGKRLIHLDEKSKVASFQDGSIIRYDSLITTMPLDSTLSLIGQPEIAQKLCYSSTHVVGLGVRGSNPFKTKCWLYFPEDTCNFYRCTIFSHYAKANCPGDNVYLPTLFQAGHVNKWDGCSSSGEAAEEGPYHSLMFEISSSVAHKPVENDSVVADTVLGAIRVDLVSKDSEIVSVFHRREERGYPTPSIGRDSILEEAFHHLEQHQIYSRGRFGSWKYEVSNQDHSFMLGVECADRIVSGSSEITLQTPHEINGTKGVKQTDRRYISGTDKD